MRHGDIEVKVKRGDLLAKLKANRAKHAHDYKKAHEGWLVTIIEEAEKLLKDAKEGNLKDLRKILNHVQPPESHDKDYALVISMLEMSADDVIEMNQIDFNQYVLDEWEWKQHWSASNTGYMSKSS